MPAKQRLPGAKRTVLFICDDVDLGEPLDMLFRMYDYDATWKLDTNTGLAHALDFQPDLMVVDLGASNEIAFNMPCILRTIPDFKYTPMVALCVNASDSFHEQVLEAGFNRYFCKPFLFESLDSYLKTFG